MESLSVRGRLAIRPALSYFGKQIEGAGYLHDPKLRPDGYCLFAVAENRLTYHLAADRLTSHCREGVLTSETGAYTNMVGRAGLRSAFASHLNRRVVGAATSPTAAAAAAAAAGSVRAAVDPEHLVVGSGCGALILHLSFLLMEQGDQVMLPTPTYGALYNDFGVLAQCGVIDVPMEVPGGGAPPPPTAAADSPPSSSSSSSSSPTSSSSSSSSSSSPSSHRPLLTEAALTAAFTRAAASGKRARLLFLINPNNPLGTIYSEGEIRMAVRWCRERKVHLVVDEIYACSVHSPEESGGGGVAFKSIVNICAEMHAEDAIAAAAVGGALLPRNTAKEFVGHAEMKGKLLVQVAEFEKLAAARKWGEIHRRHYDWWTFPIPERSSFGLGYSLYPGDIHLLKKDAEYVAAIRRAAEIVLRAWGWDLSSAAPIPDGRRGGDRDPDQEWSQWPIRLFKMKRCLDEFELGKEASSVERFGRLLIASGEEFTFSGHDLTWAFTNNVPPQSSGGAENGVVAMKARLRKEAAHFLGDYVHALYGFSKDFAMSGYRVGVLMSHNEAVLRAMGNIGYFTTVSNDTQDALAALLVGRTPGERAGAEAWVDSFLASNRLALRTSYQALKEILEEAEIPFVPAAAGMFVWLDLRKFLPAATSSTAAVSTPTAAAAAAVAGGGNASISGAEETPEEREKRFAPERALTDALFNEERILFTPGEACHATEPGFYRCCFAWMPVESVQVGFERLARFAARRRKRSEEEDE